MLVLYRSQPNGDASQCMQKKHADSPRHHETCNLILESSMRVHCAQMVLYQGTNYCRGPLGGGFDLHHGLGKEEIC